MTTCGVMYLVSWLRADGVQVSYRTTDRAEADAVAARFGTTCSLA